MAEDLIVPNATKQHPYYDDYDGEKNFHRFLYRPGKAVQARELTQMQTVLQDQINRFGSHIFKEGSIVIGGQISYNLTDSLNLKTSYANSDIIISNYDATTVTNVAATSNGTTVRAQVLAVEDESADGTNPPVLMLRYLSGDLFSSNDTIKVEGASLFANVASGNSKTIGTTVSIQDGVFFVDGYFVRNSAQTIILDRYSTTPSYKVGLEITSDIIDENEDTSLFDPAQEASNFQGPGATRLKITLTLAKRSLTSTDDSKFIELLRVENGVLTKQTKYPIYSELEKTLARRTNDESGSYTVKPFIVQLKNHPTYSNAMSVSLDAGKAYVEGFEFETIAPTTLTVERAREYNNVVSYDIAMTYGNYLLITNVSSTSGVSTGGLLNMNNMQIADIHCVPVHEIATTNTTVYNTTKIGTVRIRNYSYESAANVDSGNTHVFRAHIFNPLFTSLTGNANSATATTLQLANTINATQTIAFSNVANAYVNAIISLTEGPGAGYSGTINAYNAITRTVTASPPFTDGFGLPLSNTRFTISFDFTDVESVVSGSTALTGSANIASIGKQYPGSHTGTYIYETAYNSLLFDLPQLGPTKAGSITNQSYAYRKAFSNRTFTAGVGTVTSGSGEAFIGTGALSATQKLDNFMVVVTNNGGGSNLANGQVLSFTPSGRSVSIASNTATLNANLPGDTFTGDVLALVSIDSGTEINPKGKTLLSANVTGAPAGAANASFGNTSIYLASGQVVITTPNRTPYGNDSLYISDVVTLRKVFDFNGLTVTSANLSTAVDVTSRYKLDTGQRDTMYDHASISLKSGTAAPTGPILVCVDYYDHVSGTSDGLGYFSVDSYPNASTESGYANVPAYTSATTGRYYSLRDVIDFRPKRQNASNSYPDYTFQGVRLPIPNENFTLNYSYYIPRIDKIVLTKDREFKILTGISARYPVSPNDNKGDMTLYTLKIPAYTFAPNNVSVKYHEWKRYTMRDIGLLDRRIGALEYYSSLSLLEKDAQTQTILDANGLERVKLGTLVDPFKGHNIGDVRNLDYNCAIDFENQFCRPPFSVAANKLRHVSGVNTTKIGDIVMIEYTETPFIIQNVASFAVSVNDFLIARFKGLVTLNPESDLWTDTNQAPDVVINLQGENDAWEALGFDVNGTTDSRTAFGTRWNDWQTTWSGVTDVSETVFQTIDNQWQTVDISRTTETVSQNQTRTGIKTTITADTITNTIDGLVTDVGVVPFVRPNEVYFVGEALRPNREVFYFFDETPVTNFVQRPNEIGVTYTNSIRFAGDPGITERVTANNGVFANVIIGHPIQATFSGNNGILYVSEASGNAEFIIGGTVNSSSSGATASIISYTHYSGTVNAISTGNTSVITLQSGASATANFYAGNTFYTTSGIGLGQSSTVASYNASTKQVTLSPALTVAVGANTTYSIGKHKTLSDGVIGGTFHIPSNQTTRFRTGERNFRIIDDSSNIPTNATMSGDAKYQALGLIQTKSDFILSTRVPRVVTEIVTENQTVSSVTTRDLTNVTRALESGGGSDPLAQTFFIDANRFPEGLFISSITVFFKSKDAVLPVGIKIHPTDNGYPHTGKILPFGEKWLYPNDIKISEVPDSTNTATATTFTFPAPVYVTPGSECALVVYSDSRDYEVYVAELGQNQINPLPLGVSARRISKQPYIGSFFRSQNSSTWTPFQNQDLMFIINKCVFVPGTQGTVLTQTSPVTANTFMDVMMLQSHALNFGNTSTSYAYKTTPNTSGTLQSAFTPIKDNENIFFDERMVLATEGSAQIRATLLTNSPDVSPVLDEQRMGILAIRNIVDNGSINNTAITIVDGGTGYSTNANVVVTITGGAGSGANGIGYVNPSTGKLVQIVMDGIGSGYTGRANVAISGGGGSGATAVISSELDAGGGLSTAKYISRLVTLAEDFPAGDLRLYLDAYKPNGTEIDVYYKIKNDEDSSTFDSRPWIKMEQNTLGTLRSVDEDDFIEYEYRPSLTSESLSYSSGTNIFTTFNQFAIKVVFRSEGTIIVPKIKNFRVHALPASF